MLRNGPDAFRRNRRTRTEVEQICAERTAKDMYIHLLTKKKKAHRERGGRERQRDIERLEGES